MIVLRLAVVSIVYLVLTLTPISGVILWTFQDLYNVLTFLMISWFTGNYIYRKCVCRWLLPPITPDSTKAVLITGCDSGFGFRTAIRASVKGFTVFATCLSDKSEGAEKLKKISNIRVIKMDVTQQEDIQRCREEVEKYLKDNNNVDGSSQLYALVNNAGIAISRMIEWVPPNDMSDFEKVLDVNLLGGIRMTRAFLPYLRKSKGKIINISSSAARETCFGLASYAVSKAAFSKFSESLELEVANFGVKVITLEPFFFKTDLVDSGITKIAIRKGFHEADAEVQKFYGPDYLDLVTKATDIMEHPLVTNGDPERLVDVIEEALLSADPEKLYQPGYKTPLWLVSSFLPWNLSLPLRRLAITLISIFYPKN